LLFDKWTTTAKSTFLTSLYFGQQEHIYCWQLFGHFVTSSSNINDAVSFTVVPGKATISQRVAKEQKL
jgi:hypothetical protein